MSKVCSSSMQFEKNFISELKKRTGKKFRINAGDLKCKPDIVFQKKFAFYCTVIFDTLGNTRWKKILKNDFWKKKIENNRAMDRENTTYLRNNDWRIVRV